MSLRAIIEAKTTEPPFYFYHLIDKDSNVLKNGIYSLEYFYQNDMETFIRYSYKYRDRIVNGWGIYPGRDPDSLTPEEVHSAMCKFRDDPDGCNWIYLFKYPLYQSLGTHMRAILNLKTICRIDLDRAKPIIQEVNWGWEGSFTGNKPLTEDYYRTITKEEYFRNYTETTNQPLFATLNHIAIKPKNLYIPPRYLTTIQIPNTLNDI